MKRSSNAPVVSLPACLFLVCFIACLAVGRSAEKEPPSLPRPNPAQAAWQEAEVGVIFHYDLHVFDGKGYVQRENRITPVADHNIFDPEHLDTDQWIQAAKAMGARFALITATHETGFALYPSEANPYCLKAVRWREGKGDVVGAFVRSCRKYGLAPGVYLGLRWNAFLGVYDFQVQGEGVFRTRRQAWYKHMAEGMVREICTRYGPLFEIWFDGGAYDPARGGPDVLPIVKQLQPGALFYHNSQLAEARWGGSESGTVPYPCWSTFPFPSLDRSIYPVTGTLLGHGDPGGRFWMPAMADAPLRGWKGRHEWFWEPGDEAHLFPVEKLVEMYYASVGRNATLILGVTPGPDGRVPEADAARMKSFGDEIRRRFSKPLARIRGRGRELVLDLGGSIPANHVILMEDIAQGQRIRRFRVEGFTGDGWIPLCEGTAVGHKHIARFETRTVSRVRLEVLESAGEPVIRELSLHFVKK